MNKCIDCDREYIYNRASGHTTKRCNSCQVNTRRFKLRLKILEYLGNKCQGCGYSQCIQALDAHHINSDEKEFNISGSHSRSWESIIKELDKCVLLCSNCHREVHYGVRKL